MAKQIIITVAPDGETTVQTKGYAGPSCKDASRFIEEALGQKTNEIHTHEYHQRGTNPNQNKAGA